MKQFGHVCKFKNMLFLFMYCNFYRISLLAMERLFSMMWAQHPVEKSTTWQWVQLSAFNSFYTFTLAKLHSMTPPLSDIV